MDSGKIKRIKDEFGFASEAEAVAEYALLNQDLMYVNYPLIADELIERLKLKNNLILDIGTGLGSLAIEFAKRLSGSKIFGLDISEEMISAARKKAGELKLDNIEFILGDVAKIDLKGLRFDLITSFGVLHHLSDLKSLFLQVKNWLKDNAAGYIYDLRKDAPEEAVNEIAAKMSEVQKRAFLESVKEALSLEELEKIISPIGFSQHSIESPSFSRRTIVKNLAVLKQSRFSGEKFNHILLECFLKK